jgi:5-hydroxyisourate hydrolase-like protein (transthyretin family)
MFKFVIQSIFALLAISGFAYAQDRTLKIRFLDPSCKGSPIKGVKVKVENEASFAKSYKTDADGRFVARKLPTGTYRLTAKKYGFKVHIFQDIDMRGNEVVFDTTYKLERGYSSNDTKTGNQFCPDNIFTRPTKLTLCPV